MNDGSDELANVRRQAILANPDGVELSSIMDALYTLDDDERTAWLDAHPGVDEDLRDVWNEILEGFVDVLSTVPDEAWDEYNQRIEYSVETGLYENTVLETTGGERYRIGMVNFWGKPFGGEKLINIRERNIPGNVELVGSRIEIRNEDGILLLAGEIVEEGARMAGEGIVDNQTIVLEPDGGGGDV